ncbi:MAG: hypothetical protein JAZ05_16100, partial [Candidatus Thiodiazotropha taylori]|nr:hypothetical protein [Candidatus Thiodiazotropha taylori]MCW4293539.1 hypothetical protein [Candidatus Thiodiazotropha taylori]
MSFTVTFSYTDLAISSGSEASSSTPAWTGTAPSDVSYAITAIPNGASADNTVIDTSTGIITITNSATSLDSGGYLISATIGPNDPNYFPGSVQTASISFSVSKIDQLPNLSFPGITAVAGEDTQSSVPAWGQDAPSDVSYTLTASPNGATAGNIAVSAISGRVATTRSTTPADSGDYTLSATIGANDPRYKAGLVQTANIAISISKSDRVPHFVYGALQRGDVSNDEIHVLPNWNFSAPTDITYSITSTPLSSTDGHVSIDASSGKVTLTAQASKSDDGNYTVTATIGDNDPLYQSSSRTAVVTVKTYGSFSSTFRYDSDITVVSKGVVSSSAPIWTGTEPTDVTYQIWPSPYGKISIDSNGVITTSDTLTTADSRLYTIIATIGNNDQNFKANSAQLTEINLIVTGRSIPSFSYSALTVTAGTSISYHSPRWPTWPEKDRQPSDITYTIVERPPTATEGHITIYSTSGHLFATTDVRSLDAGTYKVRATVGNTDTMYIHGEEHTASIEVYVNKTSHLPTFNFDDLAADSGTQQQSSPPTWNNAAPVDVSYSITARPDNAVAAHVSIDTATGVITLESNATSTDNGEYTVTARIGSNDTLYANDSSKTAQIKVMVSTDNQLPYFNYSVIRRAMVATNTVMSSPAWAINPPSDVSYAITSKPANSTGGLTIDTDSGELTLEGHATSGDGGSYTVTATVGSNAPKYPPAISQTTTITV